MGAKILKEAGIYLTILVVLSAGIHFEEFSTHPLEHIAALPKSQFGSFHPFIFAFGVYFFLLILRLFVSIVTKAVNRGSKKI